MKALEFCMKKNDRLGKYDLKYNNIGEQGKCTLLFEQIQIHLAANRRFP